jgi:DNA-binding Lrp family transcriptional regulator
MELKFSGFIQVISTIYLKIFRENNCENNEKIGTFLSLFVNFTSMSKLDVRDLEILKLLQKNCRMTAKEISKKIGSPITTVYSKIKRMEELGIIKQYKAILDPKKLDRGATAILLVSFGYHSEGRRKPLSQREIAEKIARFPEVQEVHIITGEWDILLKIRADHVDTIGKLVMDKLRTVEGIERTVSCIVYETVKETTDIIN